MDSSTPASVSWREPRRLALLAALLLLALCLAGCAPADEDFGIRLESLQARQSAGGFDVRARQEISLSSEARRALRHGVPLRVTVDLALRGPRGWSVVGDDSFSYEIRYLPLSNHYQLTGPGDGPARTYPRLRHVLADLGEIRLQLAANGGGPGRLEVRMRSRLDRGSLPGPMQLPALLSRQWNLDSGWASAEIEVGG